MKRQVIISMVYWLLTVIIGVILWCTPWFEDVAVIAKVLVTIVLVLGIIKDISVLIAAAKATPVVHTAYVWKDRKRTFLGLPLSFTKYMLTDEKLTVTTGFFNINESEVRLYRVYDLELKKNFGQRILGIGTITVHSSDKSDSTLYITNVKRPEKVKEDISNCVEAERIKKRVSSREIIHDHAEDALGDEENGFDGV